MQEEEHAGDENDGSLDPVEDASFVFDEGFGVVGLVDYANVHDDHLDEFTVEAQLHFKQIYKRFDPNCNKKVGDDNQN